MKVETGLFEWLGWYQSGLPTWMSKQELRQFNLNVDPHYKCLFPINKFSRDEDTEQYYNRCHQVTSAILRQHQNGEVLTYRIRPTAPALITPPPPIFYFIFTFYRPLDDLLPDFINYFHLLSPT